MPKSKTGKRILRGARKRYGKRKGESVIYATANKRGGGLYRAIHGRSKRR